MSEAAEKPMVRVWVTPRLNHERWDETWHKSLDDAIDYVTEYLAEWINCKFTEDELAKDGYTLSFEPRMVCQDEYDAVFVHGEIV